MIFEAKDHQYLVPFNGNFSVSRALTMPESLPAEKASRKRLKKVVKEIDDLQQKLYAQDNYSLLLIFQAMDAAGKDSTIRAVTRGVNPAGFQVASFKKPSAKALDHDFLWRTTLALPERGRIGIFNRSYYEEVLVVRVHPEYLETQKLPDGKPVENKDFWQQRYDSIVDQEKHLARNGTIVLKFWLNVSRQEQKSRFISRIDDASKNWKFSSADVRERAFWDQYMCAYEDMLNATSRPWAPWYAVPADDKPNMRVTVAEIIMQTLENLDLNFPVPATREMDKLEKYRQILESE